MKYKMDTVTFMWFISTYLVLENNFYLNPRANMLLEQQISPKNPIFFTPSSPCLRLSGEARRGDHLPHPPPPPPRGSTTDFE